MSFYELHQNTVPLRKAVAEWLEFARRRNRQHSAITKIHSGLKYVVMLSSNNSTTLTSRAIAAYRIRES